MQRIQNYFILGTQLLGLAFSERFELNLLEVGGNRERWVGLFSVLASFAKKRNCISGSGTLPDPTAIIMSDGVSQANGLYGK